MNKQQQVKKLALIMDELYEIGSEMTDQDGAYHAIKNMAISGQHALNVISKEYIEEQAQHLINYRSSHA